MRYILWSGGWDSTHLLCKMARESSESIQPVYVVRTGLSNVPYERAARRLMLPLIRAAEGVLAKIKEPVELAQAGLPDFPELDAAYPKYEGKIINGFSIYGKVALLYPGIAIGIEAPAPGTRTVSRTKQCILDGGLTLGEDGSVSHGETYDADAWAVFGGMTFPIIDVDKAQMMEDVIAWGYLDSIFKHTRGCFTPEDRYCGVCGACELERKYGNIFDWRFDHQAQRDYAIKEWLKKNKGEDYADYFRVYVMEKHGARVQLGEEKTNLLADYFAWLQNNWPDVEGADAPAL